ncbi:MAG: aminopeptidase P family protein [Bacteroidetes bacterium]|nr:aminopeptidase P family protein [Bacteroidota bacterium]
MFESSVYCQRRAHLVESLGSGVVLLPGHSESPMNYAENTYPFRQDSTFLYYAGIDQPGLFLLLDVDQNRTTLFGHQPTMNDIIWTGSQPDLVELGTRIGADQVMEMTQLSSVIDQLRVQNRPLYYLPPYRSEIQVYLEELLHLERGQIHTGHSRKLATAVIAQRSVKEPREIVEIEKALSITQKMHRTAMKMATSGMYERDIAGVVEGVAISSGGRLAYPCILTREGQVLHNHHYHRQLKSGDLIVLDSGASSPLGYASDITRTYPVDEKFSTHQAEIYQAVLDSLVGALSEIRPDCRFIDCHLTAARILTDRLQQMGLMKGNLDDSVAAGAHALFFPHGLGHMMGLDVHDMENLGEDLVGYDDQLQRSSQFGLKSLRFGRALLEGFVLTVEPGCYFIEPLMEQWSQQNRHSEYINYDQFYSWKNFGGIRIEENIVVTSARCRILGPSIPKTIQEVEAACGV